MLKVNRRYYYVVADRLANPAPDPDKALKDALDTLSQAFQGNGMVHLF